MIQYQSIGDVRELDTTRRHCRMVVVESYPASLKVYYNYRSVDMLRCRVLEFAELLSHPESFRRFCCI